MLYFGEQRLSDWRKAGGSIVEMLQLKMIPIFSRFKRVTCFFIYLYLYAVKLMVPIFLVYSSCLKTVCLCCWPLSVLPKAATRITLAA